MSVLDLPLELHPSASMRPERFGALVYHFGNRRLLFLKSAELATIVELLGDHADGRSALATCGVDLERYPTIEAALAQLIESEVIRVRSV